MNKRHISVTNALLLTGAVVLCSACTGGGEGSSSTSLSSSLSSAGFSSVASSHSSVIASSTRSTSSAVNSSAGIAVLEFNLQFDHTWMAGFADYPKGDESFYQLKSDAVNLPAPLQDLAGVYVSGSNHSDDLFMYVKKKFTGFDANTQYHIEFDLTFATNTPRDCFGVGGAPGEGVTVKAGASTQEPIALEDGSGYYRMNIDIGSQTNSGSDAIALGNIASSRECGSAGDDTYELKTLSHGMNSFDVYSNAEGEVWFLFGTDSGFEAITNIYYYQGHIAVSKK